MQEATQKCMIYPGSGHGAVHPARGACSRGYKRGERGREAPKSLLEVESVEMMCLVVLVRPLEERSQGDQAD